MYDSNNDSSNTNSNHRYERTNTHRTTQNYECVTHLKHSRKVVAFKIIYRNLIVNYTLIALIITFNLQMGY
jgi:hypothetical protein